MKDLFIPIIIFAICLIDVLFYVRLSRKVDHNHDAVVDNFDDFVEKGNHNSRETVRFIKMVNEEFGKIHKRIDELQPKQKVEKKKEQPKPQPRTVGRPKKVKGE